MPSFRCSICLESLEESKMPMAALCGHIYCLDCATFHLARMEQPACAVCRKAQPLDQMIRLYPDWEEEVDNGRTEEGVSCVSSSPVSVRSIERAGEDAVDTIKQTILNRQDAQSALLTCNTFVNSVTDRERPHINTELLREMTFQLNLMSTKLQDDHDRLRRLRSSAQSSHVTEANLHMQVQQHQAITDKLEKEKGYLQSKIVQLENRIALLERQCGLSAEDATRQRVKAGKAQNELEAVRQQCDEWKQAAVRAKKKYHALRNKIEETKRAARRGVSNDTSDDLVIA